MRSLRVFWAGCLIGLFLLSGCSGGKRMRQADDLVERGRYTEAIEIYRKALSSRPQDLKLQARLKRAKQLEAERLMKMAYVRLEAKDAVRAFELYLDATRYDPENEKAKQGLLLARDQWFLRALGAEQEGRVAEARDIHERILREFRGHLPSLDALQRMTGNAADRDLEAAHAYASRGLPGNALVELLKARQLKPDDPAIEADITAAFDTLQKSAAISANTFAKAGSRLIGPPWAAYLNQRFREGHTRIQVFPGRGDGTLQIELSGVYSKLVRKSERIELSMKVSAGTTSRANPEYDALKLRVDEALVRAKELEPAVHEAQTALDTLERERIRRSEVAGAEEAAARKHVAEVTRPYKTAFEEYQKLSGQLARLPEAFQDAAFRDMRYSAEKVSVGVRLIGEIRVTDRAGTELQRILLDEDITVSDQTHPLVKATKDRPEIKEDPLQLPDEKTLQSKAELKAMAKLGEALENIFRQQVAARLGEARRLAVNGKVESAVETFLIAWLSDPSQSPDEAVRYILEAKRAPGLPLLETLQSLLPAPQAAQQR